MDKGDDIGDFGGGSLAPEAVAAPGPHSPSQIRHERPKVAKEPSWGLYTTPYWGTGKRGTKTML